MISALPYRELLGETFERLPSPIRRLHEHGGSGEFRVDCRGGARLLAMMRLLPPAAESVHVILRIERDGRCERWIRTFGDRVLTSTQWASNGFLKESMGPFSIAMRLSVRGESLLYELAHPQRFAPRVEGFERAEEDQVFVSVKIGRSFAYTGRIKPR